MITGSFSPLPLGSSEASPSRSTTEDIRPEATLAHDDWCLLNVVGQGRGLTNTIEGVWAFQCLSRVRAWYTL